MFRKDSDFEAFERVMVEAHVCQPIRILPYCVLSNHWNKQTDRDPVSRHLRCSISFWCSRPAHPGAWLHALAIACPSTQQGNPGNRLFLSVRSAIL